MIMSLTDVHKWLKELNLSQFIYLSGIDRSKENCLGVYKQNEYLNKITGITDINYSIMPISLLIRATDSYSKSEDFANNIYYEIEKQAKLKDIKIGANKVIKINLKQEAPIQTIKINGAWELVIEFNITYQKV